jgi:hypothetical protein
LLIQAKELLFVAKLALGFRRTPSATNVGRDKDSGARQRAAIESYAKAGGHTIVDCSTIPC